MASISSRVDEANQLLENGHKFMKTGLLKWTPDHFNAANQYEKAAMVYKGAGLHKKAIDANELAIKCYMVDQGSAFQAAKCMEQSAISCKELGDFQSASRYYSRAIDIYRTSGQSSTAISVMQRAAKMLADTMPTQAADLYIQASETACIEDRFREAAGFCRSASKLYLKAGDLRRAAYIAREEINCYSQAGDTSQRDDIPLGIILIHLNENDVVAAAEVLKTCQLSDDGFSLAQNLISSFDKKDTKLLRSTLGHFSFKNLDNDFAKLVKNLLDKYGTEATHATNTAGDEQPDEGEDAGLL